MRLAAALFGGAIALIAAQLVGTAFMQGMGIPVPGAVAGLILMLVALAIVGGVPNGLGKLSDLLLRHLNLFFVPAGVGLMAHLGLLARDGGPLMIAIVVSTLAGLVVAGVVFVWARKRAGVES
ncbi:Antiholin-like protein LrgA [Candidatus Phaeomarinobacter ectocarpi]|uniref:Antiholin-like protein LrgA n=1 Tax=Candidatus Phaeomarinibacter ectocarpi TaxID=1458461 RepID=X5MFS8_9HYPH|nr:CidA/LrgA family protein [Candidatus Phaeomarinobacter ectocarpi]CDO60129.1 Antiholin-like protein LrgA [Candidatus Phaeomarinobacter ectocarpi]